MCGGWVDYEYRYAKKCFKGSINDLYKLKEEALNNWRKYIIADSHVKRDFTSLVISSIDPEEGYTGPLDMINWAITNYYLPIEQWDYQYYVWHLLYENRPDFQQRLEAIKEKIWKYDYGLDSAEKISLLKETFPEFDFSFSRTIFNEEKRTLKNLPIIKLRSPYYNPTQRTTYDERPILYSKLPNTHRKILVNKLTTKIMENAATIYL